MDIVILIYDGFTALDAIGPYEVLSRLPGAEVKFVAPTAGNISTDVGSLSIAVEHSIGDIESADILVISGGRGTRQLLGDAALLSWVRRIDRGTTWTTSVCTGSLLLAAAGLLTGAHATTHWSAMDTLEELGAVARDERVIFVDKRVTSAGVSSGIDMALELAAKIAGDNVAQLIQLGIEYDPQPPFDAGSIAKAPTEIVDLARSLLQSHPELI